MPPSRTIAAAIAELLREFPNLLIVGDVNAEPPNSVAARRKRATVRTHAEKHLGELIETHSLKVISGRTNTHFQTTKAATATAAAKRATTAIDVALVSQGGLSATRFLGVAAAIGGLANGPLPATGARRLQASPVLAGLLLDACTAEFGLVPAVGAATAVRSPAALAGAAPQDAVHLDDGALGARRLLGRAVAHLRRLRLGRRDQRTCRVRQALRQGERRRLRRGRGRLVAAA